MKKAKEEFKTCKGCVMAIPVEGFKDEYGEDILFRCPEREHAFGEWAKVCD